jgi:hypothetical protein
MVSLLVNYYYCSGVGKLGAIRAMELVGFHDPDTL